MGEHNTSGLRTRLLIGAILLLGALALGGTPVPARAQGAPPKPSTQPPGTLPGCVSVVPTWGFYPDVGRLFAVSALTADDVWAVGSVHLNGTYTMLQHWDGQSWEGSSLTNGSGILWGVAMVAHNDVWAVESGHRTWHWDGVLWSLVANPSQQDLTSIAAINSHDVWAAGGSSTVHWDGTTWSNIPNPLGNDSIAALAARASNDVWAVGGTDILHWDGSAWSKVPNAPGGSLVSVTAPAANDAWATGSSTGPGGTGPIIEHWDGTAWSAMPLPALDSSNNVLTGIAGSTPTDVWAVGSGYGDSDVQTLVLHWDGTAWSRVPSGNTAWDDNRLTAVSAPAPGVMWAVGIYEGWYHSYDKAMSLHYTAQCPPPPPLCDGTFHVIASPNVRDSSGIFYGVAALAANDAWAVGAAYRKGPQLLTHWDGQRWQRVPSSDPRSLYAISARTASDIWAVGDTILHWDGTQWTHVPGPLGFTGSLYGVVAIAANDVWAVGDQILHWDGMAWSLSPDPRPAEVALRAVAAVSSTDLWAVGGNLILHWDGTFWQSVAGPPDVLYNGVIAFSSTNAWAVGSTTDPTRPRQRIVHWDGQGWTVDASVNDYGVFYGIGARSNTDLWVAGSINDYEAWRSHNVTLHRGTTAWATVGAEWPEYNPGSSFYGVAPVPGAPQVWAVGNSAHVDSLTEQFQPACSRPQDGATP